LQNIYVYGVAFQRGEREERKERNKEERKERKRERERERERERLEIIRKHHAEWRMRFSIIFTTNQTLVHVIIYTCIE
jgi:hypothetical protein